MSIRVVVNLKDFGGPDKTSKLTIPEKWSTKEVSDIIKLFADAYNKSNPDHSIDIAEVHLEDSEGTEIFSNSTVSESLEDRAEYNIRRGVCIREVIPVMKETRPRCKNYGCNQYFSEEENHETACRHHNAPPIFHDTMKCWSCCKNKKAYDFEEFQQIPGCCVGPHSLDRPALAIAPSPTSHLREGSSSSTPPPAPVALKSIDDFNSKNPNAATAAASAVKTIMTRKSSRNEADGTARCLRKGCQRTFLFDSENGPEACRFHAGQPVFHDVAKFWSCCPEKKCYDFDEFMAVPGCAVGCHDDGVVEIN